jgi:hypothetical protein
MRNDRLEYCCECDQPTGRAGRGDDSIYVINALTKDEVGPLCPECRDNMRNCGLIEDEEV